MVQIYQGVYFSAFKLIILLKPAKETGIREAFLTLLSDDAIVFHPEPIKGKPLYA